MKKHRLPFKHTRAGVIKNSYLNQKYRSKKYGFDMPSYTEEELNEFAKSDKRFESLYLNWFRSGFDLKLRPVFDRIDNKKGYSFDNIQVLTYAENCAKSNTEDVEYKTCVVQMDLKGFEIDRFKSAAEASRITGIHKEMIKRCCQMKKSKAGGYKWKRINLD